LHEETIVSTLQTLSEYGITTLYDAGNFGYEDQVYGILSKLAQSFSLLSAQHPSLKLIIPFVRTPVNLVTWAVENSPMAPIAKRWRDDFRAGGARKDMAIAKMTTGSLLWAAIYNARQEGLLTGPGPADKNLKGALKNTGWQEMSIRYGDKWYSFNRSDPFALQVVGLLSAMDAMAYAQSDEDISELMAHSILAVATGLSDKTYMKSAAELMSILTGKYAPEEGAKRMASGLITSFAPFSSGFRWIAKSMDTDEEGRGLARDAYTADSLLDSVVKRFHADTPWGRDGVPLIRDWKGDPVVRDNGGFFGETMPFSAKEIKEDYIANMLWKNGINIRRPRTDINWNGQIINLLALDGGQGFVYEKYTEFVGKKRYSVLKKAVPSKEKYESLKKAVGEAGPDSRLENVLRQAVRTGTEVGKAEFIRWYMEKSQKHPGWIQVGSPQWEEAISSPEGEMPEPNAPLGGAPEQGEMPINLR